MFALSVAKNKNYTHVFKGRGESYTYWHIVIIQLSGDDDRPANWTK